MQFGIFLVQQGVISAQQFTDAVSRQMQQRVPMGQLAMARGMLTKIHVLHILSIQTKTRQLFGEIAAALEYVSKEQLAELFMEQHERLEPLSEILVAMGALTTEKAESRLHEYRCQRADSMDSTGVLRSVI